MKLRHIAFGAAALAAFMTCAGAAKAAVVFEVAGGSYDLGSGWGETSNPDANLLNVDWSLDPDLGGTIFSLANPGDMFTIDFGTAFLQEEDNRICDANPPCGSADETDNLEITAVLELVEPSISDVDNPGTVVVLAGSISDASPSGHDLTVTFDPVTVFFGDGGSFLLDLSDVAFSNNAQTLGITAKFTLLTPPGPVGSVTEVPEPASIALFGIGLAGLLFYGWRRRKTA